MRRTRRCETPKRLAYQGPLKPDTMYWVLARACSAVPPPLGYDHRIVGSRMTWRFLPSAAVVALALFVPACDSAPASAERAAADVCAADGPPKPLNGLSEASGAALSRRTPGVIWSHNDSGQPLLHALDAAGQSRGRVRIPKATGEDWEDISVAACSGGSCLYVADIGDNNRARRSIT